jgi:hypothetical protein
MVAQMRYVLEEQDLLSQRDVIEQHKMLMQLPHVTQSNAR